jgi:hypothetical protein
MTTKLFSLIGGAALLALAGTANAGQALTDGQMDQVTAGLNVTAVANAAGVAFGEIAADTTSLTSTETVSNGGLGHVVGVAQAYNQTIAVGGIQYTVQAISLSQSEAGL